VADHPFQRPGAGRPDAEPGSPRVWSISELAAEFGVTARTIRFYEDRGLIAPARAGQRRIYEARDRVRLKLILRGKRLGLSLAEIREILDLYDTDTESGERAQLLLVLRRLRERRAALARQRVDIDLTLAEIDALEEQFRALLDGGGADRG